MQFNRYVFDCYLATEAGQKALAFFTQLPKLVEQRQAQTLRDFLAVRLPSTQPLEYWQEQIELAADWTLAETEENSPARMRRLKHRPILMKPSTAISTSSTN